MPWADMMAAALRLGVSPEAFWRLSLREWLWLVGGSPGAAFTRAQLDALMQAYPDDLHREENHGRP